MSYSPALGVMHDAVPGVADRHPAVRYLDRQAAGVQDAARRRWHPGYASAIIAAVNTVISAAYYMKVLREMWMKPAPDGDIDTDRDVPSRSGWRSASVRVGTVVLGILPGLVLRFADLQDLTGAFGG